MKVSCNDESEPANPSKLIQEEVITFPEFNFYVISPNFINIMKLFIQYQH